MSGHSDTGLPENVFIMANDPACWRLQYPMPRVLQWINDHRGAITKIVLDAFGTNRSFRMDSMGHVDMIPDVILGGIRTRLSLVGCAEESNQSIVIYAAIIANGTFCNKFVY